jgi:hypothetical protein
MVAPTRSTIDTPADQMFPRLDSGEIERIRRFVELRRYTERGSTILLIAQCRPRSSIMLKMWREAIRVHRTAFANLSEYRLPVASVVLPQQSGANLSIQLSH